MREEMTAGKARAIPGVIDSLSEGFVQINRILWIILIPIGLDVLLWRAPRISAAPLANRWLDFFNQVAAEYGSAAAGESPIDAQSLDMARRWIESSALFDLLSFVTWNLANVAVPTIVPSQHPSPTSVVEIDGVLAVLGLVVGLQLLGLALGCVYLGFIGQQVRYGRPDFRRIAGKVWRNWRSTLAFMAIVLGVVLVVSLPLSVIVGVLSLVAPAVAAILYGAAMVSAVFVSIWMLFYLFFLADAIVLNDLGPLAAVRSSVAVVRGHLGSSLALIGLSLLISLGMQVIWTALARQPWGLALAIVGNAYVASGLVAASMYFYRNRSVDRSSERRTESRAGQ